MIMGLSHYHILANKFTTNIFFSLSLLTNLTPIKLQNIDFRKKKKLQNIESSSISFTLLKLKILNK